MRQSRFKKPQIAYRATTIPPQSAHASGSHPPMSESHQPSCRIAGGTFRTSKQFIYLVLFLFVWA
jgi:hypothetical protein